jgi:DNA-binding CsgD family transcriptional regulator
MTRADDILARMRADTESDWPTRLMVAVLGADTTAGTQVTPAEVNVLRCLSQGTGIDGAADLLSKSEWTIRDQILSARRRLRAKDNAHAVALAIRQGLIA